MLVGRAVPWETGSLYGSAAVAAMGKLAMRRQTSAYDDHQNAGLIRDAVEEHDEVHEVAQRRVACRGLVVGIGMAPAADEEPEDWRRNGFEVELRVRQRPA